jgi:cytochrome oxidase assembly protein ShyY1
MVHPLLTPRMLAVHALAVVAVVAATLLGSWQYDAWQEGREDRAAALVDAAPRPLGSVMTSDQAFPGASVGRPVRLSGRWLPGSTVLVADRELDGRDGVWAVTPVAVCRSACATAPAMLVVRGWAPSVRDVPAPPSGRVQVTGWLQPGEGSGLTDPDPADDVIPELRIADAIQHVDQDLYGGYVIAREVLTTPQTAGEPGLEPVTPASLPQATAFTSLRNFLYALEWWVFGGFAAYVWWRWCRDELAEGVEVPSTT